MAEAMIHTASRPLAPATAQAILGVCQWVGHMSCSARAKRTPRGGASEDALASSALRGQKSTYCDLWAIVAQIH